MSTRTRDGRRVHRVGSAPAGAGPDRTPLTWAGLVAGWAFIVLAAAVVLAAVVVPRMGGGTPYAVTSSSMEPTLTPGTLVVVRPVPADRIGPGDVITYQLESGRPAVATHRVVSVATDLTGAYRYTTRGDANETEDAEPVRPEQVRGRLWYAVPYLGHVNLLLSGQERAMARTVVAGLLLGYAGFMFIGAVRERRRRAREEES
ncbi:signal peptidase I [Georgenia deserti]|uniref:Signal peptidase I n=1 Tax=Georgenia deserti TaxID=2093781 RepID=A0ABW4L0L6_9MICO